MFLDWWMIGVLVLGYGICYWTTYTRAARLGHINTLAWLIQGKVIYIQQDGKILPVQNGKASDE